MYKISGMNENSGAKYEGALMIANDNEAYKFSWQTSRGKYTGVGVQFGDAVAVAYSESGDAAGCGVVLYRIGQDGLLSGRIATIGDSTFGTERAERLEGTSFAGKYSVSGTTSLGEQYGGTMDIQKDGQGYGVIWRAEKTSAGFGIWQGDHAAIGIGGMQCSFAVYRIRSNGDLEGRRGSKRSVNFAFEDADRQ